MDAPTTSLGKRKAPAVDAAAGKTEGGQQLASFASVPDVCWQLVSSFASPPDVYNLALSSKHFFRPVNSPDASSAGDDAAVSLLALSKPPPVVDPAAAKKSALQGVINSATKNDGNIDVALYKIARDNGYSKPFILHNILNALPKGKHEAAEVAVARGEAVMRNQAATPAARIRLLLPSWQHPSSDNLSYPPSAGCWTIRSRGSHSNLRWKCRRGR